MKPRNKEDRYIYSSLLIIWMMVHGCFYLVELFVLLKSLTNETSTC